MVDAVVEALVDLAGEVPVQVDAVEPLQLADVLVINLTEYKIGHCLDHGGVKSTPSSPRLRVGVILTDPEPVKEAL